MGSMAVMKVSKNEFIAVVIVIATLDANDQSNQHRSAQVH